MDRQAWHAAVHGVSNSQTVWLNDNTCQPTASSPGAVYLHGENHSPPCMQMRLLSSLLENSETHPQGELRFCQTSLEPLLLI